jgi:molybdopterin molybdotransferase
MAGEDLRAGQIAVKAGTRLRPQEVAAIASTGTDRVICRRRLKVGVLSTGDELVQPGQPLGLGQVFDSNRHLLAGLIKSQGAEMLGLGAVGDAAGTLEQRLREAAGACDVILTTGGVSRGESDFVVETIRRLGSLHAWQIAVKPGRPLAFGQLGRAVFIGLPGNPVAAMICFLRFARPVLTALGGGRWPEPRQFLVPADFVMKKKPGRREYLRARLVRGADGRFWADKVLREGSGVLTSLAEAEGLVELTEDSTGVRHGDLVEFVPFSEFGLAG